MKISIIIASIAISFAQVSIAQTLCPDGSFVGGSECNLAPDGTFVGGEPTMAPDGTFVGGEPAMAPDGSFVGDDGGDW